MDGGYQKLIIQDFGFHSLKSYYSMLGGESEYTNKDHYTAPEHLKAKGKVVKKPTHKGDIYSIGTII